MVLAPAMTNMSPFKGSSLQAAAAPCARKVSLSLKWAGLAIWQAGYAPPQHPARAASKAEGETHGHVIGCGMFMAGMVEGKRQAEEAQQTAPR